MGTACVKGDVRLSQASDRKGRAAPLFSGRAGEVADGLA